MPTKTRTNIIRGYSKHVVKTSGTTSIQELHIFPSKWLPSTMGLHFFSEVGVKTRFPNIKDVGNEWRSMIRAKCYLKTNKEKNRHLEVPLDADFEGTRE